jgi:Tol biopolymer transport system component
MRKLTGLLAGALGLAALVAFVLVVVLLFGGLSQRGTVPTVTPPLTPTRPATPTVVPTRITPPPLQTPTQPASPLPTPTPTPRFRAENIRVVEQRQLTTDGRFAGTSTFGLAWSPGGDKLAFPKLAGGFITSTTGFTPLTALWIADITSMSEQELAGQGYDPAWSPDGRQIAFTSFLGEGRSEVWVAMVASGQTRKIADNGFQTSWLANNRLAMMKNRQIWAIDLATNLSNPISDRQVNPNGHHAYAISPQGRWLVSVDNRVLWLVELDGPHTSLKLTDLFDNSYGSLVWAPTGNKLAYVADKSIWVATVGDETNQTRIYQWQGRGSPGSLTWSPDGNVLAFLGPEGIAVINADGSGLRTLVPYGPSVETSFLFPLWSPDGSIIAVEKARNLWLLVLSF